MLRTFLSIGIILLTFFHALSQAFTTTVASATIGKNQYAEVSYEMSNASSIEDFTTPKYKDWIVISGPANSTYQSNINGQITQKTTLTYYLQPKHTGNLVIEGARATLNGKTYTSNNITVKVLNKDVSNSNAQPADPFGNLLTDPFSVQPPVVQTTPRNDENFAGEMLLRPNENVTEKIKNNLFIKVIPSKNTCYEGEPIMATYKVYTRLEIDANVTRRPSFSGFSAFDMEEPNQPYTIETLNGKKYKTWVIRKVQLYPLQSGKLSLDPVEVECNVHFIRAEKVASSSYDPYGQDNFTKVPYTLTSPMMEITALPLPSEGRPQNFAGAVGNFNIKTSVKPDHPGKGDAVHLNVAISGNGNFSMVHAPLIKWPAGTEAYDAKEIENLAKSVMPITGDKIFDYVFIPHHAGSFTIPAVQFSYFDVNSKMYKIISTQSLALQVANESHHSPIAEQSELNLPVSFTRIAAYALPVLAAILLSILIVGTLRRRKKQVAEEKERVERKKAWDQLVREADQAKADRQSAVEANWSTDSDANHAAYMPVADFNIDDSSQTAPVIDHIDAVNVQPQALQAESLLWHDDHRLFFKVLKLDVLNALSVAAEVNHSTKTELFSLLKQKGVDEAVLDQVDALIQECDATLYSPVTTTEDRQKLLEEAEFLLSKL